MDAYRPRKYRGPEVWARVREAYVAGETGPSAARRFDVGLACLRKKAMKEGWTRNRVAVLIDASLPEAAASGKTSTALEDQVETVSVALVRAAQRAAWLIAEGRASEAHALIRAARALAELTGADGRGDQVENLRRVMAVGRK